MNSSKTLADIPATSPTPVLVADGGLRTTVNGDRDPFEALDDLMMVVEQLCPVWPSRPTFAGMPPSRL
ncbi:MAG: hypothetical protein ABI661_01365 [Gammaproteobacteria bacterium]